ncbi:hypothetical protein Sjap_005879 [Stephania japonica]|uniref:Uncharacterized protein n=1 Tax=Stephania japonica TaxID=461633 RepID=A0AAP0PMA9_9MAGN
MRNTSTILIMNSSSSSSSSSSTTSSKEFTTTTTTPPHLHQQQQQLLQPQSQPNNNIIGKQKDDGDDDELEGLLKIRRPPAPQTWMPDSTQQQQQLQGYSNDPSDGYSTDYDDDPSWRSSVIDAKLSEFAKKMPMFEPSERVKLSTQENRTPLGINLELALYRAKVLARNSQFKEADQLLNKCISFWPDDGRSYVALGKILSKQSKTAKARAVYEKGCQATQGENPFIWQAVTLHISCASLRCWAVLESKMGNTRKARELFDAATVADKKHVAAWHGWAVLELKQGNVKKARHLLSKALKYCGGNEYVYQTLALLEAKANRIDRARYLFRQATKCNPKSCASWLSWAQLEIQQENNLTATDLFEKAVQASPKNRFAWHVWGVFEANLGDVDKGRKLLKIGHALNPRDPVLLQSLALLEYKHSTSNLARVLFRKASELDPKHQPVWVAWGWMEWKEGNISTARQLYQKALSIDSTSESAARCLQAWGVLEQRIGNISAARRLLRSSLNINSQSYVTWMTWALMEEEQGNSVRAEEIRNLYFQQRTEVVDDGSWVTGLLDVIDPALDNLKKLLNFDQDSYVKGQEALNTMKGINSSDVKEEVKSTLMSFENEEKSDRSSSSFDLDGFVKEKLSLDTSKLEVERERGVIFESKKVRSYRNVWKLRTRPLQHL